MEGHNSPTNGQKYIYKGQEYVVIEMSWWRATNLELYETRRLVLASTAIAVGESVEVDFITIITRLEPTPVQQPVPPVETAPTLTLVPQESNAPVTVATGVPGTELKTKKTRARKPKV